MRLVLLAIATLFCCSNTIAQPYKNLVLEGGGIRGLAYPGALSVLEEKHVLGSLENVAGTSVGSIVGCLVVLGYTPAEMKDIMEHLKVQQFNDGRWMFFGGFARMRKRFGWYRGDAFEKWIGEHIKNKTGNEHITFRQLHALTLKDPAYKDLYVTATNLSQQCVTVFNWQTFPDMELKTAVRTSMSIPLYFGAVLLDTAGNRVTRESREQYDVYIDGGLLANYPLTLFDDAYPKQQTLGLKLDRPEQIDINQTSDRIAPYDIKTFSNYMAALYNISIERLNKTENKQDEVMRTIYISTGTINPRVKRVSIQDKQLLYGYGKTAAELFLNKNGQN